MKALVIIDVQNDYFPKGKMELKNPNLALKNIKILQDKFINQGYKPILIKHINNNENAAFFAANSIGAEIHKDLNSHKSKIIIKSEPDAFMNTELEKYLQANDINELVICGMMTHMCIDTTVRTAYAKGFNVTLISDACTTKDLMFEQKIIDSELVTDAYMAALQRFAKVLPTKEYLQN